MKHLLHFVIYMILCDYYGMLFFMCDMSIQKMKDQKTKDRRQTKQNKTKQKTLVHRRHPCKSHA